MASEPPRPRRTDYPYHFDLQTRWMDNDLYGHVNNVTYYSYFDTAVNFFLIERGGLDIHDAPIVGVVVESQCNYTRSLAYPEKITCGLRVGRLGNSSVRYEIGIFGQDQDTAAASGHFVHVFVDRATNTPVPIPDPIRRALADIEVSAGEAR